jgi:hypothetical protein
MAVPDPKLADHDGVHFIWEWVGEQAVANQDWYFDIKLYSNVFAELPYEIQVAERENTQFIDGKWRIGSTVDFQCGTYWAVQIAKRNPDGSYAGPLSAESNRLPVERGCVDTGGDAPQPTALPNRLPDDDDPVITSN